MCHIFFPHIPQTMKVFVAPVWHIGYTVVKEYEYRQPQVLEGI